jgi:acyl-CoA thioester hydrolase
MLTDEIKIRVRYGETDKMGYVYYGNYAQYYEIGRTELVRKLGFAYKDIEEQGILLPIASLNIKYIKPAQYDDLLTLKTFLNKLPTSKIEFSYEIFNEQGELINVAETTLVFIDKQSYKPINAPEDIVEAIKSRSEIINKS